MCLNAKCRLLPLFLTCNLPVNFKSLKLAIVTQNPTSKFYIYLGTSSISVSFLVPWHRSWNYGIYSQNANKSRVITFLYIQIKAKTTMHLVSSDVDKSDER